MSHAAKPVVDVLLHLVLGIAVASLELALELLTAAVDLGEVVVGQLAPFLLDLAGELLPVAFDAIPVHAGLHCCACHPARVRRLLLPKLRRAVSVPLEPAPRHAC